MNSTDLNFQSQMHSPFMLKLTPTLRTAFNLFAAASSSTTTAVFLFFLPNHFRISAYLVTKLSTSASYSTTTSAAVLKIPAKPIIAHEPIKPPQKTKSSTRTKNIKAVSAASCSAAVLSIPAKAILAAEPNEVPTKTKSSTRVKTSKAVSEALLKENWLDSLSCPMLSIVERWVKNPDSEWVLGVDPDVSGALAVLRPDRSVEVFDSPHLKVRVGKGVRKRLDAKSIVQLVKRFNAPIGTTVYVEQSLPFPQDGKQGWWSGGFGYGMWIGILVASGFSVVPVPSLSWKNEFKLSGSRSSKDASRELASELFPSTSSLLKRKKDHGRAEALLIAAYGKGLKLIPRSSCMTNSKLV
ncbi:hypothetical protein Leryth_003964 [Lithospermum erythrorhizon]|nr:hypothetical protein Leryth_003964 [Lithospermum erythrorhizon]